MRWMLEKMPRQSSLMDTIPNSLWKSCADVFGPVIARLANISFRDSWFLKILRPFKSRRCWRSCASTEFLTDFKLEYYFEGSRMGGNDSGNLGRLQSAYRGELSTGSLAGIGRTLLIHRWRKIDHASEPRYLGRVRHGVTWVIGRSRFQDEFGITGKAVDWMWSYLSKRSQFVKMGGHRSSTVPSCSGIPQGSVLGSILFSVYMSPIANVVAEYEVRFHQFADDMQIYVTLRSKDWDIGVLQSCTDDVWTGYLKNDLLLNPDKSKVIVVILCSP